MENKQEKDQSKNTQAGILTNKYVLYSILFGSLLPLGIWITEILLNGYVFDPGHLIRIHRENPIIIAIDLAPIVLGLIAYLLSRRLESERAELKRQIKQKDDNINQNALIANRIGRGDFDVDQDIEDKNDVLARSLLIMRDNLLETNRKEADQAWISKGKDQISNLLRMHNNLDELSYDVLVNLIKYIDVVQGSFYVYNKEEDKLVNHATYAYNRKKYVRQEFKTGHGLIGACAYEKATIYRTEIPEDHITITSGILGDKKPVSLLLVPLLADEELHGVIEFASIREEIPGLSIQFVEELSEIIARTIFNLKVNTRTEQLLRESQKMTSELRENEEQLRQNAEEMRATQEELEKSNEQLEQKINEVQNAQKRQFSLLENASEVISILDENGIVKYESPSVKNILGYNSEEIIGQKAFSKASPETKLQFNQILRKLIEQPFEAQTLEFTYPKQDGSKIWLETTGRNLLNDPAIDGVIFNTRDITQRKIAEKEQRMRGQMQSLSENSLDMIIRIGTDGKFFYSNPQLERFTGKKPKDIYRKAIDEVDFEETLSDYFRETITIISDTKSKTDWELTLPTPEGEKIMQMNAIPEFNENKELETLLVVGHDITERKQIELEIQEKNKNIEDSINYAKRIQNAILPNNQTINQYLPNSFIFYRPKDVVSGDFPWFFVRNDIIYISAVDCTGHGVPGALLSFIGYFQLNNIVDHDRELNAGQILDILHDKVRKTMKQEEPGAQSRDGMDVAFCKIKLKERKLEYAGAHRPLYLIREGELIQYKGDSKAIGGIPLSKKKEKDFENHPIDLQKGDKIFFFSDGLPDQMGGPKRKKYNPKQIREKLVEHKDFSMSQFNEFWPEEFDQWKAKEKQIDDVLLIGIEF